MITDFVFLLIDLSFRKLFLQHNQKCLLRFLVFIGILVFVAVPVSAQNAVDSTARPPVDSVMLKDSVSRRADTLVNLYPPDSVSPRPRDSASFWHPDAATPLTLQVLDRHPYFDFKDKPLAITSDKKIFHGKETLFYVLIALLLVFALLKLAFAKYFNDLFRVFFRTTMKQRQIREQLMQTPLPSLLFNVFFVASAGLYIDFLLGYFNFRPIENFWLLYLYCALGLSTIYFVKFIGLKICGWLFNMQQAADSYIFIVFIINKVIGIFLLPFLVLLAFTSPDDHIYAIVLVLSWCGVAALYLYRFILGYSAVRNEVRFNLFHFFLYLCAFELAPLLLIYRLLLFFFS